ncbi:helix-turn-helix transcriptional regulator [Candidatus Palauibacter sp.]|uniref:helix-turn-helix transcriptional regulator n=1 Tax=Candidatus Palauibacter sp. TaxID=3101350 RepID=UPI003C701F0A
MRAQDPLNRTLALLHEATLDDTRSFDAACQLNETCGTRGSVLLLLDGCSPADMEVSFARFWLNGQRREDWERKYFEDYFPWDPRVPRVLRQPGGELLHTPDLYTEREKRNSPAYEALLDTEAQNGLHVRQAGPSGSHVAWILADSLEEDWTSAQVRLIHHLQPHVFRYVSMRQQLAEARALGTSLSGLLDSTRLGVIQLDQRGRIVTANDRALTFLKEGAGLGDEGGFLRASLPMENSELSRLLANALPPFGAQGRAGSMLITRSLAPTPLVIHINPVGEPHPEWHGRQVAALVLVVDPARRSRIDPKLVAAALGLTPMESEVAVELAAGHTIRDIARSKGRSEGTVRAHAKRIFRKQGISRQGDLVLRVMTLEDIPDSRD